MLLARMRHEVFIDHIVVNQRVNVELLLENGLNKSNCICRHKPLKLHLSSIFVRQSLVLVL